MLNDGRMCVCVCGGRLLVEMSYDKRVKKALEQEFCNVRFVLRTLLLFSVRGF